ncbi:LysE family translocator [Sphingomonas sp.]|uniref:LysE family translocator n=1 Tax=Sphingomonas sp. TaxID=28214 RepID=UPI000DB5C43E|nr:LysE family translocator [Sphingomonas sp.]PZU09879.1 MAG: lysine transporter LysE [Sphingomonas sp.]
MPHLPTLAAIAGVYFAMVASPGPNFLVVSQLALSGRTRLGVTVAVGVATGSLIWATLAMMGVAALLARAGHLYDLIRLAGAAYLIWCGIRLAWNARSAVTAARAVPVPTSYARAYRAGLMTNLTNPKAGAFWTSVFSSMFPPHAPVGLFAATLVVVVTISGGWYALVAIGLATDRVRRRYLALRRWIDAACGTLMIGLGLHLAANR